MTTVTVQSQAGYQLFPLQPHSFGRYHKGTYKSFLAHLNSPICIIWVVISILAKVLLTYSHPSKAPSICRWFSWEGGHCQWFQARWAWLSGPCWFWGTGSARQPLPSRKSVRRVFVGPPARPARRICEGIGIVHLKIWEIIWWGRPPLVASCVTVWRYQIVRARRKRPLSNLDQCRMVLVRKPVVARPRWKLSYQNYKIFFPAKSISLVAAMRSRREEWEGRYCH